ncbi:MAG: ABC transporter ATP-binding protein [Sphingobacteriia bacterium]|jgi:lipopolysaccharide transport system ATP-binding protein
MSTVIKVENLAKQYRLGDVGTGTLSHDLKRWWYKTRGKEDPYLQIGDSNDRSIKAESDYVWALKDINFEVKAGEVLGIIGRNGAGKSTLLKILSKTTAPTTGKVKVKGRIASLLEVGTGFHPELSGRENIFLNGAILGMTKKEIQLKFDEIVDFSGVERYIDTPVKRYSSGMYVRLAFAVAAHLEPEILIVDEVLAVGDAEFQKKCLGKMKDVSVNEGRTVLFVSHNMAAVKTLCSNCLVIEKGEIKYKGDVEKGISFYLKGGINVKNLINFEQKYNFEKFFLHKISLNPIGESSESILDEYHEIELNTFITINNIADKLHLSYVLSNDEGQDLFTFTHANSGCKLLNGFNHLKCFFPKGFLNVGTYYLSIYFIEDSRHTIFVEKDIISFEILIGAREIGGWMGKEPGFIKPIFNWSLTNSNEISD